VIRTHSLTLASGLLNSLTTQTAFWSPRSYTAPTDSELQKAHVR
jgi:hypothetical protein